MHTVTRIRRSVEGFDADGDPLPATEDRTDIAGCALAPRQDPEPTERGRHGAIVGLTLYAPIGTDLVHTDEVEYAGTVYVIDGEPGRWENPWAPSHGGVEVALKRAVG